MSDLAVHLGPLGALRPLATYPEIDAPAERESSERTTLGGIRVVQRAPRAARTWSLSYTGESRDDLAYLIACGQGAIPGPIYLHTADAAKSNLFPDHMAAAGLALGSLGTPEGVINVVMPGSSTPVPTPAIRLTTDPGPWSHVIPLRTGVTVMVSMWSAYSGSGLEVRTVTADGAQVGMYVVQAYQHTAGRWGYEQITPGPTVAGLQVRTYGTGRIGGLRLTEGAHEQVWVPGVGVPQVEVGDPQQKIRIVNRRGVLSDWDVTLREVGS